MFKLKKMLFSCVLVVLFVNVSLAQMGRPVSIDNLGDWQIGSPILMVNTFYTEGGTPFNDCYMEETYQQTTNNITVMMEYIDAWPGPVGAITNVSWYLKFTAVGLNNVDINGTCLNWVVQGQEFRTGSPFYNVSSSDGTYYIKKRYAFGGSGTFLVQLVYNTSNMQTFDLGQVTFISPDMNGDGTVNLSDNVAFTICLNSGTYCQEADFSYNGSLNLSDIVIMTAALGTTCN